MVNLGSHNGFLNGKMNNLEIAIRNYQKASEEVMNAAQVSLAGRTYLTMEKAHELGDVLLNGQVFAARAERTILEIRGVSVAMERAMGSVGKKS